MRAWRAWISRINGKFNMQLGGGTVNGDFQLKTAPSGQLQLDRKLKPQKARSGALSELGDATLTNRRIEAEFFVDLVDDIAGVPLFFSGPTGDVQGSVPKGAVASAWLARLCCHALAQQLAHASARPSVNFSAVRPHRL